MRCFFHLCDGSEELLDQTGVEVESADEARTEAVRAVVEMQREDRDAAGDWTGWEIKAVDEAGRILFRLPLEHLAATAERSAHFEA